MAQEVLHARHYINSVKQKIEQSSTGKSAPNPQFTQMINKADQDLEKAESLVEQTKDKLKQASVIAARTKETANPSSGVKRALAAIQSAPRPPKKAFSQVEDVKLYKPMLEEVAKQASAGTELVVGLTEDKNGIKMVCKGVFLAGLWFAAASDGALSPEYSLVFGIGEHCSRWRSSKHKVYGVFTERATAAISYFWVAEAPPMAVKKFMHWLAMHKTLFQDMSFEDGRRLAFDASRAIFLPPCVRAFDGDKRPRHPRACVPERQERTERMPTQQQPPQQAAAGNRAGTTSMVSGAGLA